MIASAVDQRLNAVLSAVPSRVVACSGGVDSLLLAHRAHVDSPDSTLVAHAVTPAVPPAATARVLEAARQHGWSLRLVTSTEFDDERYLNNPRDRCYFCKTHLYDVLRELATTHGETVQAGREQPTMLSGANLDDLAEFRPGLAAAAEFGVRHPWVEAGVTKSELRALAAGLELPWADLPASPCLASRLYTGTRVTPRRLRAIDVGEELVRSSTAVTVVRCRLRMEEVLIEVPETDRHLVTPEVVERVEAAMRMIEPSIGSVQVDRAPYAPGRAFSHLP